MPSFKSTALAVAAAFVTVARAQDYYIDPETVPEATRDAWCLNQRTSCPIICSQIDDRDVMDNSCNAETLTYGCLCGDGQQPDLSEYTLTIPYYVCTEAGTQCVTACGRDNECSRACREDNPCGAQDPQPPNATTTADVAPPSETPDEDEIFEGLAGDDGEGSGAAGALRLGKAYGLAAVLGGLFAGFALM